MIAVANAGLILQATLVEQLGIEATADGAMSRGYRPGRKVATVVHGILGGAECIDDLAVLRAGATERVLPGKVMAPSTIGMWLRSFTFSHVRQLDKLTEAMLTRAWAAGAGPGAAPIRSTSTRRSVRSHGYAKQGAAYGYTRQLGYHPLLATRADTAEVLHTRMRKGSASTAKGAQRFVRETIGRIRRTGATGPLTLRADSGFWSNKVITACTHHEVRYSSRCAARSPSAPRSRPSRNRRGSTSPTPTGAMRRSPRPFWVDDG